MSDTSGPAFPTLHQATGTEWTEWTEHGLTKREYFAALALVGMLTRAPRAVFAGMTPEQACDIAVQYANALLAALQENS